MYGCFLLVIWDIYIYIYPIYRKISDFVLFVVGVGVYVSSCTERRSDFLWYSWKGAIHYGVFLVGLRMFEV